MHSFVFKVSTRTYHEKPIIEKSRTGECTMNRKRGDTLVKNKQIKMNKQKQRNERAQIYPESLVENIDTPLIRILLLEITNRTSTRLLSLLVVNGRLSMASFDLAMTNDSNWRRINFERGTSA